MQNDNNNLNNTPQQIPTPPSPAASSGTNSMVIVGFILAFLLPLVGLILSILGLSKVKQTGEKGRNLAIGGIAVSIAMMVISIVASIIIAVQLVPEARDALDKNDTNSYIDDSDDEDEDDSDDNTSNITAEPETKTINKSVTDSELGYTITVKKLVTNVPIDADSYYATSSNGYVGVAVEVELKNHSEYTGGLYPSSLGLNVNGDGANRDSSMFKDYIADNSITALGSSDSAARGTTKTGWLFFYTTDELENLVFRYTRRETKIIGGDTIPAKNFDIKL